MVVSGESCSGVLHSEGPGMLCFVPTGAGIWFMVACIRETAAVDSSEVSLFQIFVDGNQKQAQKLATP